MGLTVSCYVGALTLIGIMFYWFNPPGAAGGCSFNIVIIVLTLLLCLSFSLLSIHPLVSTAHCRLRPCSCSVIAWQQPHLQAGHAALLV